MFILGRIFENVVAVLAHWANVASLLVLSLPRPKASSTDDVGQQGDIKVGIPQNSYSWRLIAPY